MFQTGAVSVISLAVLLLVSESGSTAETAAVLDVSEGAVRVRVLRALRRLREILSNEVRP